MNAREQLENKIVHLDKEISEVAARYTALLRNRKQLASELLAAIVGERNPLQIKSPE